MIETLIPIITVVIEEIVEYAVEQAIEFVVRKVVDGAGKAVTQIVHFFDSDGDGELDSEEILLEFNGLDLEIGDGYYLCNYGDEIGIGFPQIEIVDGREIADLFGSDSDTFNPPAIIGDGDTFITDLDGDGIIDEVLKPIADFTGDGISDFIQLIDNDDNGLPDASPYKPFYPVGSDEYDTIIEQYGRGEEGIMTKPLDNYNVSEGLLALILLFTLINFVRGLFRRSDYLR